MCVYWEERKSYLLECQRTPFIWESSTRFHSISPTIVVAGVGLLSGKGPWFMTADVDSLPRTLVEPWMACESDTLCEKFHIPNIVHPELPGCNDRIRNSPTVIYYCGHQGLSFRDHVLRSRFCSDRSQYYEMDENCYPTFWADDDEEIDLFAFIHHVDPTKVRIGEREVKRERFLLPLPRKPRGLRRKGKLLKGLVVPTCLQKKVRVNHGTSGVVASTGEKSLAAIHELFEKSVTKGTVAAAVTPTSTFRVLFSNSSWIAARDFSPVLATTPEVPWFALNFFRRQVGTTSPFSSFPFLLSPLGFLGNGSRNLILYTNKYYEMDENCYPTFWADDDEEMDLFTFIHHVDPTKVRIGDESTGEKSLAAIQELFEKSTLNVEVGVTAAATVPFVTPSVSLMPEYSPCHASSNVADAKVSSIARSRIPDPPIMTTVIATTVAANISFVPVPRAGDELAHASIFADFASIGMVGSDVAGPSQSAGIELSADRFYVSQDMDSEILVDHLAPPVLFSQLRSMDYDKLFTEFNVEVARQTCLGAEAARVGELDGLKEKNVALEGQVAALEFASLSCDELSIKASSLKSEKDKLIDQVSTLEGTCSGLRDEVSGYKLFKEQIEYLAALGRAISRAIDKGMQDGLVTGIDHAKAGRGLAEVAAYKPAGEANYVSAVNALRPVDFLFLAQLASYKDASMSGLMDLLRLKVPAAKTPEANQLQPSHGQLMLPTHRLEDQVVIGETSLSFSLDASSVPPIPVADDGVLGTEQPTEVLSPSKIVFEKEELETTSKHTTAS
nr:hypothetical protein [Tanacetum cinerariifolium]